MKTFGQVLPSSPKIPGSFFFSSLSSDEGKIREVFGLGGQDAQPLSLPASQPLSHHTVVLDRLPPLEGKWRISLFSCSCFS